MIMRTKTVRMGDIKRHDIFRYKDIEYVAFTDLNYYGFVGVTTRENCISEDEYKNYGDIHSVYIMPDEPVEYCGSMLDRFHINKVKKECVEELRCILGGDISIPSLINYIGESSRIEHPGRAGTTCVVNKEALRLASVYLEDYMKMLEKNT